MFGEGDALLTPLVGLLRRVPIFFLFGNGTTRLQPAYVGDVAAAMADIANAPKTVCELAGPNVLTYRSLVELICRELDRRPLLVSLPFAAWKPLAFLAEKLPRPPVTRNQIELMRHDNVASRDVPGFADLHIVPKSIEDLLPYILAHGA